MFLVKKRKLSAPVITPDHALSPTTLPSTSPSVVPVVLP
jgi:hypothetical protein